jgi:hypothetical protein
MRATVALKQKLVQEKSGYYATCAQEDLDFWKEIYREQMQVLMQDRWAFIMTAKGFCRSPEGYYGPTKFKRFIQAMYFTDQGILRHIVTFL